MFKGKFEKSIKIGNSEFKLNITKCSKEVN